MAILSPVLRLSAPLKSVLERASEAIGKPVVILSDNHQGDYDWANFSVVGLANEGVCLAMQQNRVPSNTAPAGAIDCSPCPTTW